VARSLRAAGRRLVAAPRQGLIEADLDARALRGSAPYLGTLIRRRRGFFDPCAAQPHRCGRRDGVSELTIGGLLGHSVPRVTGLRTYPRFTLLATADRVSARIAAVLDGESRPRWSNGTTA
jgi:hypothetical protein